MGNALFSILKIFFYFISAFLAIIFRPLRRRSKPDLSGDIALVTGAGQGLGKEIAFKLAECGATLVLWDINKEKLQSVRDELIALGKEAFSYAVDCSRKEEIYAAAERVKEEVGDVSILVNNAGVVSGYNVLDLTDEQVELTMKVNTLAHFWVRV